MSSEKTGFWCLLGREDGWWRNDDIDNGTKYMSYELTPAERCQEDFRRTQKIINFKALCTLSHLLHAMTADCERMEAQSEATVREMLITTFDR